jgi:Predicted transcriptional regulator
MNLSERIKAARKHAGLTQQQLAQLVGVAQTAISQLESGKAQRTTYIAEIAYACAVSSKWLALGEGEMQPTEGSSEIDLQETPPTTPNSALLGFLSSSMSPIAVVNDGNENEAVLVPIIRDYYPGSDPAQIALSQKSNITYRFSKRMIEKLATGEVVCVSVSGSAMTPVLGNGSVVAVDTGRTDIEDGKIYVIRHSGQLRTLFAYRIPGGGMRLRSMNPKEYPEESYTPKEMEENSISIIGRVFWGASFL